MGKTSKRRAGNAKAELQIQVLTGVNTQTNDSATCEAMAAAEGSKAIPRQRLLYPEDWEVNMAAIDPFLRPEYEYICVDAEKYIDKSNGTSEVSHKNKAKKIEHFFDCPVCFQDAPFQCKICKTVNYCSQACQKVHWKESHKKSCQPNPNWYKFRLDLSVFAGLTPDCFQGHEFLVVKPTGMLGSLQEICYQVLESADDLFDVPGFGQNQLDSTWVLENTRTNHPVYKHMAQKFGWASGNIGHELVYGYRAAEARVVYFLWCDDCFQSTLSMAPSYYGEALFPPLPPGKHVRGKIVVYKLLLKKKQRRPQPQAQPFPSLLFEVTDDADLQFEYIMFPMNKAELALMLAKRTKAMERGAYTTRMWRYHIRAKEREIEMKAKHSSPFI